MDKKIWLVGLAAALLLCGGAFAMGAMNKGTDCGKNRMNATEMREGLGLDEDATMEEVQAARFQKRLSDLGLTEDDTIKELRAAVRNENQERHEERLAQMRDNLGLDTDATEEEVKAALEKQRGDGKGMRVGPGMGMREPAGFGGFEGIL